MVSVDVCEVLSRDRKSHLIDVRTASEWEGVGIIDLTPINKQALFISWRVYPDFKMNPTFLTEFLSQNISKDDTIFFLCRSGGRSLEAANYMALNGYKNCINVSDGFEAMKLASKEALSGGVHSESNKVLA